MVCATEIDVSPNLQEDRAENFEIEIPMDYEYVWYFCFIAFCTDLCIIGWRYDSFQNYWFSSTVWVWICWDASVIGIHNRVRPKVCVTQ